MGLNDTPSGERIHIGFFGRRNVGKSSLVNAVTGQNVSIVSDVKGTTTDPVSKAMELLPMGPVLIIDTPGFDDIGMLGELRIKKTRQILNKADCAVLVVDATMGKTPADDEMIYIFKEKKIPYIVVYNKCEMAKIITVSEDEILVSALENININELKERIAVLTKNDSLQAHLLSDLINPDDFIVLVTPIDSAAPKGRLILPQQQVVRDILDSGATAIVVQEAGLAETLKSLVKKPALVVTDSQAFNCANANTPQDIPLTSFSILMARYKGFLETSALGAAAIEKLRNGDKVLISEGCTHHRQCDDIGTYKLPKWLREYTGKELVFETTSGREFPDESVLSQYSLIIHCGGCMLNGREMQYRKRAAEEAGIPFTNYGIAIAYMQGILMKSIEIFPELTAKLNATL